MANTQNFGDKANVFIVHTVNFRVLQLCLVGIANSSSSLSCLISCIIHTSIVGLRPVAFTVQFRKLMEIPPLFDYFSNCKHCRRLFHSASSSLTLFKLASSHSLTHALILCLRSKMYVHVHDGRYSILQYPCKRAWQPVSCGWNIPEIPLPEYIDEEQFNVSTV